MNKKLYRFSYFMGKDPLLHELRDGDSFSELLPYFIAKGYQYEGLLLNFQSSSGIIIPQKDDLIISTTRPPLDDEDEEGTLRIPRSHSALENKIFDALRHPLSICSRREVYLNSVFIDKFLKGYEDRCKITFTRNGQKTDYVKFARYLVTVGKKDKVIKWKASNGIRTGAYLIYMREAWSNGPDLLVCFGMTASCGLIWAHLVRTKFSYLLDTPVVAMAEIIMGDLPHSPNSLDFCEKWNVNIVLECRI